MRPYSHEWLAMSRSEITKPHRFVSPHKATNALQTRGFGRLLWPCAEKRIFQPGTLGVIRRIAGHAEHHPDRITEHDPTTAGPESLGA